MYVHRLSRALHLSATGGRLQVFDQARAVSFVLVVSFVADDKTSIGEEQTPEIEVRTCLKDLLYIGLGYLDLGSVGARCPSRDQAII